MITHETFIQIMSDDLIKLSRVSELLREAHVLSQDTHERMAANSIRCAYKTTERAVIGLARRLAAAKQQLGRGGTLG
jgi:hypothetical protein